MLPPCPYCGHEHAAAVLKCTKTDMVLPLQGRMLEEKFRLVRKLGKGGMASVWLALNTRVDREVAIKLIRPEVLKNDELVARFSSEAKAAGRIEHPNVCDILDFGLGPVGPYIVMEYLRGHTLSQMIKRGGPLSTPTAARLVREALAGLAAAHKHGIVHRDLKPENVFLHETPGGKPVVKIMDFGVAKLTDGSSEITTEQGALLGTPEYMAPEQFLGADMAEPRTDLWAVGAILYRALTGEHAFKGPTVAATLMKVSNDEPKPLRELAPQVPDEMAAIVERCLAKEPADRFSSARALRDALERFEVDEEMGDAGTSSLRLLLDRVTAAGPEELQPPALGTDSSRGSTPVPTELASPLPRPAAALPDPELGAPDRTTASDRAVVPIEVAPQRRLLPAVLALGAAVLAAALWFALRPDPRQYVAAAPPEVPPPAPVPARAAYPDPPDPDADNATPRDPEDGPEPRADDDAERGRADDVARDAKAPDNNTHLSSGPHAPAHDTAPVPSTIAPSDNMAEALEPLPANVVLVDSYVVATTRGKRSAHGDARKYCEALHLTSHAGIRGWKLPFPGLVAKLATAAGLPSGRYWTSARWKNRVKVYGLPSGQLTSSAADRKIARALCIAKAPKRFTGTG